jgi:hypothetical protein
MQLWCTNHLTCRKTGLTKLESFTLKIGREATEMASRRVLTTKVTEGLSLSTHNSYLSTAGVCYVPRST